ncbi:MAG: response regulator [Deltaproteobacteria bacterium]|nr:response regulator [Deltaproteobacteria bacterium]
MIRDLEPFSEEETTGGVPAGSATDATSDFPATQREAQLIVLNGRAAGQRFPLVQPTTTIGRNIDSDIRLMDSATSRQHARIECHGPTKLDLIDLGSRNGTIVDGKPITQHQLVEGDKVIVGENLFIFTHANPIEERLLQLQKMEAIGRLVAGLSHEFNNLLAGALTNVHMLLDEENSTLNEEQRECLQGSVIALERGTLLTRQMLDFSLPTTLRLESVDVSLLVADVIAFGKTSMGPEYLFEATHEPSLYLRGDRRQLYQCLVNLLLNARDALPGGGRIELSVARRSAKALPDEVTPASLAEEFIIFEIRDEGVGMEEQVKLRVFEPFFTTKPLGMGTGLGLSVVHSIIRSHGGSITIDTKQEVGTTMKIMLRATESPGGSSQVPSTATKKHLPKLTGRVLVVDDDRIVRRSSARLLHIMGLEVSTASDGQEAVERLEEHAGEIDVVILDLGMPGWGGRRTLDEIRRRWPRLPVVIATGYAGKANQRDELLRAGARAVLIKPFSKEELALELETALSPLEAP